MNFFLKTFSVYLVTYFINVNAVEVGNNYASDDKAFSNYITVTFDEIYITDEGMFIEINREPMPVNAIYFDGVNQYRCDIHNNIKDLITCQYCETVYNRYQYRICPNKSCPSRRPGPKA